MLASSGDQGAGALKSDLSCCFPFPAVICASVNDAALHGVQFMDDGQEGWAVGDEGVIWHTIDGGKLWERQKSGVQASLRCVHFISPEIGWAAGREELPLGGGSAGVILVTDGEVHDVPKSAGALGFDAPVLPGADSAP